MTTINPSIFKAYDVRGLYPSEVNEDAARSIGRGFVSYLGAKRIAVSRDMRLSSPSVAAAFIEGARDAHSRPAIFDGVPRGVARIPGCDGPLHRDAAIRFGCARAHALIPVLLLQALWPSIFSVERLCDTLSL